MKIGILTLPFNNNYGGFLQEYALMTVLKRMGHDVCFIDLQHRLSLKTFFKQTLKNVLSKVILGKEVRSVFPHENDRIDTIVSGQYTRPFVDKYLCPKISPVYSSEDLKIISEKMSFDAFVVGSDQIWRPKYAGSFLRTLYLDFVQDNSLKKISYAASFGTDKWEYSEKIFAKSMTLIKEFDAVSVREGSGSELCEKYFGVKAQLVLDPTLLLAKEDYIKLIEEADISKSAGNLFCYVLDDTVEKQQLVDKVANEKMLTPFYMGIHSKIKQPVEMWLRSFYDAEFVITDSYHGMLFSIIFNKPFFVIGNVERGLTRFNSLLKLCELEDHLINSIEDIEINKSINWNNVEKIISLAKDKSFSYINLALDKEQ